MLKWSRAKRKCREEIKEEQSGEIRRLDWRDAALRCGLLVVLLPLLNVRLALQEECIFSINNSKTDVDRKVVRAASCYSALLYSVILVVSTLLMFT